MKAVAPPPPPFHLTPRPYQYEAVAALLAAAARGVQWPLLVLPTGTGKTIIFALLVQQRGGLSLILAHRDELIQQAVDKLHLVDPMLPLGVVQAAQDGHDAPTIVAERANLESPHAAGPPASYISLQPPGVVAGPYPWSRASHASSRARRRQWAVQRRRGSYEARSRGTPGRVSFAS
jgi:hypothetical protein